MDFEDLLRHGDEQTRLVVPFAQWAVAQGSTAHLRVLMHLQTIDEVTGNLRRAKGPGFEVPDVWAVEGAALVLEQMAQAAGFPDAAAHFKQVRESAVAMSEMIAGLMRQVPA